MKLVVSFGVVVLAVGGAVVGCGSPAITCQTQSCNNDTKTYKACSHVDGSVSYEFGGMSCSCNAGDQSGCNACATQVASYCGGGGVGGTGGTGGGGSGGGGGGVTCSSTFSGGLSGTVSPCAMTITDTPAQNQWVLGTAGNNIPGTSDTWAGLNIAMNGAPMTGTFDLTMTKATSENITPSNGGQGPVWVTGYGSGMTIGTMTVTVSSLGTFTAVGSANLYQSPHGSVTATLIDMSGGGAAPVMQSITF